MKKLLIAVLALSLYSCEEGNPERERVERKLDNAGEKIEDKLEEAADSIESKAERLEDKIEKKTGDN